MATLYKRICANANGAHKSGANTLSLIMEAIAEYDGSVSGDWTNLAHVIGKQRNSGDRKKIALIVKASTGGVFVIDAKQPSGYRLKKDTMIAVGSNTGENRAVLADYVASGVSFRNSLDELIVTSKPAYVLASAVASSARRADKEGYDRAAFMKAAADAWDAIEDTDEEQLAA